MGRRIPRATHMGELKIAEYVIPCAVLDDGTRVLTESGFLRALGRAKTGRQRRKEVESRIPPFMGAKNLKPYISKELQWSSTPIMFKPLKGGGRSGVSYGYRAELLAEVCKVFLEAKEEGAILPSQEHIVKRAAILMRGFATVGIIALVDEATGYQADRDRDELHRILELYIAKELLPWTKRFPNAYYEELFRLRGWQYSPLHVKRPILVGKLTNQLVYEKLPKGVLEELAKRNPKTPKGYRRHRHHQFLTEDIGNPHLEKHLVALTTLMRVSPNWPYFKRLFKRAFAPKGQMELEFREDEQESSEE